MNVRHMICTICVDGTNGYKKQHWAIGNNDFIHADGPKETSTTVPCAAAQLSHSCRSCAMQHSRPVNPEEVSLSEWTRGGAGHGPYWGSAVTRFLVFGDLICI